MEKSLRMGMVLGAVALGSVSTASAGPADASAAPPDAVPGQCYARVLIPAKYKVNAERFKIKDETQRVRVLPTQYKKVVERVLVKDAGEKLLIVDSDGFPYAGKNRPRVKRNADGSLEILPGAFDKTFDRHEVKQETWTYNVKPAKFETVTERVMIRPARSVWKYNEGRLYSPEVVRDYSGKPVTRVTAGGKVLCLVNEPAQYKTITRRVVANPPVVKKLPVEAKHKRVQRLTPKRLEVRRLRTPPEYKTLTHMVVEKHASVAYDPIPAEFKTIERRYLLTDSKVVWRRVLCETNIVPNVLIELQTILRNQGYNPGPIDGRLGRRTMDAVRDYQRVNGLAVGGLTIETLTALGISLPDGVSY